MSDPGTIEFVACWCLQLRVGPLAFFPYSSVKFPTILETAENAERSVEIHCLKIEEFFHWETLEAAAVGKGSSPLFSRLSFCFSRSFLSVSRTHLPTGQGWQGNLRWKPHPLFGLDDHICIPLAIANFANYTVKEGGSASFGVKIFKRWTHNFSAYAPTLAESHHESKSTSAILLNES